MYIYPAILFFLFLTLSLVPGVFAYQIEQPSKPESQREWNIDHDAQREYEWYREGLRKNKEDERKKILRYMKKDATTTSKPVHPSTK